MYIVEKGPQGDSSDIDYNKNEFENYVSWVKDQEGFSSTVYDDAAGIRTVGYGHTGEHVDKLTYSGEESFLGITEEQGEVILRKDLSTTFDTLRQRMANRSLLEQFDSLDNNAKMLLLDYEYNLGDITKSYPKMLNAVLNNDWKTVKAEYERNYKEDSTGELKPLKYRNDETFNRFIKHRI